MSRDGQDDTSYAVVQLRNDVDDLGAAIQDLPDQLGAINSGLDAVRVALRKVENRSVEVEASTQELGALVKRLDARVEWLERNIRLKSAAAEAHLDDVDHREIELAQVAEAGHVARADLLPPAGRSALEAAVDAHSTAVRAQVHHRDLALAACEVLASTALDDARHIGAVAEFRAAVAGLTEARKRVKELSGPALEAAEVLTADEQQQV